jgi:hypothetical protein
MIDNIICVFISCIRHCCKDQLGLSKDSVTDAPANDMVSESEFLSQ